MYTAIKKNICRGYPSGKAVWLGLASLHQLQRRASVICDLRSFSPLKIKLLQDVCKSWQDYYTSVKAGDRGTHKSVSQPVPPRPPLHHQCSHRENETSSSGAYRASGHSHRPLVMTCAFAGRHLHGNAVCDKKVCRVLI